MVQLSNASRISPQLMWLRRGVELTLVCGIAYFAVKSVLGFAAPQSLWTPSDLTSAAPLARRSVAQNTEFSFTVDPFHRDVVNVLEKIGADAPETTLSLKLFGRRTGPKGSAILQTPDKTQDVFEVGEEIIPGVTLKSVNPGYIVLSRNGALERLTFDRKTESTLGLVVSEDQSLPKTSPELSATPGQMTPSELMSAISFKRVMSRGKNGRVKGFEIRSTSDKIKLSDFGLQDGDLITAIGDENLTQGRPEVSALIMQLSTSNSVTLSLIRGETPLTITVGRP